MISNDKNDKAGQSSKVTVEYVMESKSLKITWEAPTTSQAVSSIVFPAVCSQCTCTARVTVVVLCVCLSVRRLFWQYVQSQVKTKDAIVHAKCQIWGKCMKAFFLNTSGSKVRVLLLTLVRTAILP